MSRHIYAFRAEHNSFESYTKNLIFLPNHAHHFILLILFLITTIDVGLQVIDYHVIDCNLI